MNQGTLVAAICAQDLHKSFVGVGPVLVGLNFEIRAGEIVALLGPSGSGKSTLLRLVAGLEAASSGSLHVLDTFLCPGASSFVFQESFLLPWKTVLENVLLPLELLKVNPNEALARAKTILLQVGLGDALELFPRELSGGMKMRVSFARALVTDPKLLLLDEPFAALDENVKFYLAEELRRICIERSMTVLFVTHSITEASFLADRALVFSQKPAKLCADERINLPSERSLALRSTSEFSAVLGKLMEVFLRFNPRQGNA